MFILLCSLLSLVDQAKPAADGFVPLVKGDDVAQFEIVGLDKEAITIKDGEVRLAAKAEGYFATKQSYKNYVLQFEWLYEKHHGKPSDGNSGLMVHMQGPGKIWTKSIEVQIWYKEFGSFYTHSGAKFSPTKDDPMGRNNALKPVAEWNLQEVACKDGAITLKVNGFEYAAGVSAVPDEGRIGWMAEGSPVRFRNMKIKAMK